MFEKMNKTEERQMANPASTADKQEIVQIAGDVSGTTGKQSYVSVQWTRPVLSQGGI